MEEISPIKALEQIKNKELDPKTIDETTRRLIIQYLDYETYLTDEEIATLLGISRTTVWRDKKVLQEIALKELSVIETVKHAKELIILARKCQGMARKAGSYQDVWRIENELTEKLGKMGVIYYKGDPVNLQVHIGDKNETHVNNIIIGEGAEGILGAINNEVEEINRLKEFLTGRSN